MLGNSALYFLNNPSSSSSPFPVRCDRVPNVICPHKEREEAVAVGAAASTAASPSASPEEEDAGKLAVAGAMAWRDVNK